MTLDNILLEALGKGQGRYLTHTHNKVELQNEILGDGIIFSINTIEDGKVSISCEGCEKGLYVTYNSDNITLERWKNGEGQLWIKHNKSENEIAFECMGKEKGKFLSHAFSKIRLQNGYQGDGELWKVNKKESSYDLFLQSYFDKAIKCINELKLELPNIKILTAQYDDSKKQLEYFKGSQVFNTRLQQNPLVIVYCENANHVKIAYNTAIKYEIPIRVRSGGHDHEGESSGTNVVTIDLSKITTFELDTKTKIAKIGAGNRFICLTSKLADLDVMIAHGTCATVCITGFTLGGGWGPWTRKMGMNCEYLKGATIMLGNGDIIDVDESPEGIVPDLLWALRGGGGLSYGIVTELRIQTFDLPKELIKFELNWNPYTKDHDYPQADYPTLDILMAWEKVIQASDTSKLIGTNLKINARPFYEEPFNYTIISHNCCMYGYWEGTKEELTAFVKERFVGVMPILSIKGEGGTDPKTHYTTSAGLMNNWDRESFAKIQEEVREASIAKFKAENGVSDEEMDLAGIPIPPDLDDPAPHKITSRLVNNEGLGKDGYKQLLLSLTSSLIKPENRTLGIFTYVTLGAIVGDYYKSEKGKNNPTAFPYKDKLYTIQYQAWWNVSNEEHQYKGIYQDNFVYNNTNLAMDWIDTARNFEIPNTSGAFISFKDINIPTSVYFDKSYEKLKTIKINHSLDPFNHFRTRKTII
jgi:hypothetical protein